MKSTLLLLLLHALAAAVVVAASAADEQQQLLPDKDAINIHNTIESTASTGSLRGPIASPQPSSEGSLLLPASSVPAIHSLRPASSALPIHALRGGMEDDGAAGSPGRRLTHIDGQDCPIGDDVFSDRRLLGCSASGAIITNGLIKLGVSEGGELNTGGGIRDALGRTNIVGLRYILEPGREAESTSYGCPCEGWGARATGASSTDYGYANQKPRRGCDIGTYDSFTSTADSAVAIVTIPGGRLEVTHDYHPSPATDNMYEVVVTLRNLSDEVLTNIGYRRAMDWDIWPTPFSECSTIGPDPLDASALFTSTNNGFNTNNMAIPLSVNWYTTEEGTGPFEDLGPRDHGAAFDFDFDDLNPSGEPGHQVQFKIFYGAAPNTVEAEAALGDVGAEVYSLGKSRSGSGGCNDDSVVFIMGFSGVGGVPAFLPAAPSALCNDVTVRLDVGGNGSIAASEIDGDSNAASGIASLSVSPSSFTCANVGPNPVTLTVADNNGMSANCTSTVTIEDKVAPAAVCQDITVQLDAAGIGGITPGDVNNGSTDVCGIASTSANPTNFTCADVGANNVTLTVMDNNANVANCVSTVTVEDKVAPAAVCQDITVQLDAAGKAVITTTDIDGGSTDVCGIASLEASQTSFTCADVGENTITLTATDVNGNTATCTSTVTVEDSINPIAICKDHALALVDGGGTISPDFIDGGSYDNCGYSRTLSRTSFDCKKLGNETVTLTVTDDSGNKASCTSTITVHDEDLDGDGIGNLCDDCNECIDDDGIEGCTLCSETEVKVGKNKGASSETKYKLKCKGGINSHMKASIFQPKILCDSETRNPNAHCFNHDNPCAAPGRCSSDPLCSKAFP